MAAKPKECDDVKELSCTISRALDLLKYGYNDIQDRIHVYKTAQEILKKSKDEEYQPLIAGSRAEGVSSATDQDSDFDFMLVMKNIVCCDVSHKEDSQPSQTVLGMAKNNTTPGYTMLSCKSSDKEMFEKKEFLSTQRCYGQLLLGHDYHEEMPCSDNKARVKTCISGPAISAMGQFSLSEYDALRVHAFSLPMSFSFDGVPAILYICSEHMLDWKQRTRYTDWPGKELIEEISQMNGHVVPVGNKGSEDFHLEWRICYTEAEIKLVHSLNDTQLKLYVLLKMVAKKLLKPICLEISSYIMKNVLFWFVERVPSEDFKPENLLHLVIAALSSLFDSVAEGWLPNYMIPKRNLFAGRLSDDEKEVLLAELKNLIHVRGPTFLLHYKEFESIKSAVEKLKLSDSGAQETHAKRYIPFKQLWDALPVFEPTNNAEIKEYLETLLATLGEEKLKQCVFDIYLCCVAVSSI